VEKLGNDDDWTAEWKWDGIRGQLIKRQGKIYVWSRGEDLVTEKFPEFKVLSESDQNNFVIDGEIIPLVNGIPLPFQSLQTRLGRKSISKKQLKEVPIHLIAYDLLEIDGIDIRNEPLWHRRKLLEKLIHNINSPVLLFSEELRFANWNSLSELRQQSRINHAEGIMIKKKSSTYGVGRQKGAWWKWKVDPLEIDAVMLYAQRGHGRRANLYTDFTFAVKDGENLVPFTKAYSGLTDEEFRAITAFVRKNTIEKFGPVVSVIPELVFTLAFEGISESKRHKSGVALRFPRINRWRKDKSVDDIDTIQTLKSMLK
jgi:DNA ligase-1